MDPIKKRGAKPKYPNTQCVRINATLPLSLLNTMRAESNNVSEIMTRILAAHYGLDLNAAA